MDKTKDLRKEDVVYLDETGIDDNEEYPHAWSLKGSRACAKKPGFKKKRLSILAALKNEKIIAPFLFEGSCSRGLFESWLEEKLLPLIGSGKTIIMDNASFHKGGRIQKIIKNAGCKLIYLPPYSPEFNPIERCWSWIKNSIRKLLLKFNRNIFQAAKYFFLNL